MPTAGNNSSNILALGREYLPMLQAQQGSAQIQGIVGSKSPELLQVLQGEGSNPDTGLVRNSGFGLPKLTAESGLK